MSEKLKERRFEIAGQQDGGFKPPLLEFDKRAPSVHTRSDVAWSVYHIRRLGRLWKIHQGEGLARASNSRRALLVTRETGAPRSRKIRDLPSLPESFAMAARLICTVRGQPQPLRA